MTRQVELPDGVRVEAGIDEVNHLAQLALLPPDGGGGKPLATIGLTKRTTVALCLRLMAVVERLDDIAEKRGSVN